MLERLQSKHFDLLTLHHAEAILLHDMEEALVEIEDVLDAIALPIEELVRGGGGEGQLTQRLRKQFKQRGWDKHNFQIKRIVDEKETASQSHEVDHVKHFKQGTFALEIEWNNKDPFYDRDLESFQRLHADGAISAGCIITRGSSLQSSVQTRIRDFALARGIASIADLTSFGYAPTKRQIELITKSTTRHGSFAEGWAHAFVSDKFGEATTHWRKLEDRVLRGVGNPCPLLLIGIPDSIITT